MNTITIKHLRSLTKRSVTALTPCKVVADGEVIGYLLPPGFADPGSLRALLHALVDEPVGNETATLPSIMSPGAPKPGKTGGSDGNGLPGKEGSETGCYAVS